MNLQFPELACPGMLIGNTTLYSLNIKRGYYEKQKSKNYHPDF